MGAWKTGTTRDEPHSGQGGIFLAAAFLPVVFFRFTGHVSTGTLREFCESLAQHRRVILPLRRRGCG